MEQCIFCKIASGEIPCKKVYEDERAIAFYDLNPQAPTHVLVIPKAHYANVLELARGDASLAGHLTTVINAIATQLGLEANGFRVVINTGKEGGQTVGHIHMHLLAGRDLTWPPG